MMLDELTPERISLDLDVPTKKRTLEVIAQLCAPASEQAACFQALVDREKLGSTGLGHGVALPHARIAGLEKPTACFLHLQKPIQFESIDEQAVDLIFGLLVPESENDTHLRILANIASIFTQAEIRESLRHASSPGEALQILSNAKGDSALAS